MDDKKRKNRLSRILKTIPPLLFGLVVLWLIYRDNDFGLLLDTLKEGVNYPILGFSLLFGLGANIVRGLRWDLLIRSLGETPQKKDSILTVLGNYAVNMALPRMGEVWRCGAMSNYSGISFPRLFGTLLVDRISDFVIVGLLVAGATLGNLSFFTHFLTKEARTGDETLLSYLPYLFIGGLVGGALIWIIFRYFRHTTIVQKVWGLLYSVYEGLRTISRLQSKWLFILYSILLWGGYFLFFYTTFFAFDFTAHLGIRVGIIAFIMGSIAMAAPVQAGMGAWHFMVIYTLVAFGVERNDAGNFTLIVHTIQTLWTTLCGVAAIILLGVIHNGSYTHQIDE